MCSRFRKKCQLPLDFEEVGHALLISDKQFGKKKKRNAINGISAAGCVFVSFETIKIHRKNVKNRFTGYLFRGAVGSSGRIGNGHKNKGNLFFAEILTRLGLK